MMKILCLSFRMHTNLSLHIVLWLPWGRVGSGSNSPERISFSEIRELSVAPYVNNLTLGMAAAQQVCIFQAWASYPFAIDSSCVLFNKFTL